MHHLSSGSLTTLPNIYTKNKYWEVKHVKIIHIRSYLLSQEDMYPGMHLPRTWLFTRDIVGRHYMYINVMFKLQVRKRGIHNVVIRVLLPDIHNTMYNLHYYIPVYTILISCITMLVLYAYRKNRMERCSTSRNP